MAGSCLETNQQICTYVSRISVNNNLETNDNLNIGVNVNVNSYNKTICILQINLNHCRLAHSLLEQTALEQRADVVVVNDPLYSLRD